MTLISAIDKTLLLSSFLLFVSVVSNKLSVKLGVPTLIFFLVVGVATSEARLIERNAELARFLGVVTLVLILFLGGISTDLSHIRPILLSGILLSTLGVLVTTFIVGFFLWGITASNLKLSLHEGLLIGAIVSSTDAAAVFSILRSRKLHLKAHLGPLLEFESGSNDVMVYFLMTFLLGALKGSHASVWVVLPTFLQEMLIGGIGGWIAGHLMLTIFNKISLKHQGLYPALALSMIFFFYSAIQALHGSGFLGTYIAGIVLGHHDFIHKKSFKSFGRGIEWIMQIMMFIALGLLVTPAKIYHVMPLGIGLSLVLLFLARPLSVYSSLAFSHFTRAQKLFVSWVGLRGAVPIVFATYLYTLPDPAKADAMFHLIFFIVLLSVLLQGTTLYPLAKALHLEDLTAAMRQRQQTLELPSEVKKMLIELTIPTDSPVESKPVVEAGLPKNALIILLLRGNRYSTVRGSTVLQAHDKIFVMVDSAKELKEVRSSLGIH